MPHLITKQNQLLQIQTPLTHKNIKLNSFNGHEALSRPFSYQLDILSEQEIIAGELMGQGIHFQVASMASEIQHFHGLVNRITTCGHTINNGYHYRIHLMPWFWFLRLKSDCRTFKNASVVDIIQSLFQELRCLDVDYSKLQSQYPKLNYCVQYNESVFDFISRLLENAGISYYFRHEPHNNQDFRHVMVLIDQNHGFEQYGKKVSYLSQWQRNQSVISDSITLTDYDFKSPKTRLLAHYGKRESSNQFNNSKEQYHYPGGFKSFSAGNTEAKLRWQILESQKIIIKSAGNDLNFSAGLRFHLANHDFEEEQGDYLITQIYHKATDQTAVTHQSDSYPPYYQNYFHCIPANTTYRAKPYAIKPDIHGIQMAQVSGSSPADQLAQINLRFHWDHHARTSEQTSCKTRCVQRWAGHGFGTVFIPRIGQEVMTEFLQGDPDKPIVNGAFYNASHSPPYHLPGQYYLSGIKTQSIPSASHHHHTSSNWRSNELRFNDKPGAQEVHIHTPGDLRRDVKHNDTTQIAKHYQLTIEKGDQSVDVGNGSHTLAAHRSIRYQVGKSYLQLESGQITIAGKVIKVNC